MNHYRFGSFTSRSAQAIDQSASAMPRKRTQSWSMHRSRGAERTETMRATRLLLKSDPETG